MKKKSEKKEKVKINKKIKNRFKINNFKFISFTFSPLRKD